MHTCMDMHLIQSILVGAGIMIQQVKPHIDAILPYQSVSMSHKFAYFRSSSLLMLLKFSLAWPGLSA